MLLIMIVMMNSIFAQTSNVKVFISFSMPENLIEQMAHESARLHVPLIVNGLHNSSMRETLAKIFDIAQREKNVSIQIDPVSFNKYGINRVPSVVVDNNENFDVIAGNIKIANALKIISDEGTTGFSYSKFVGDHNA